MKPRLDRGDWTPLVTALLLGGFALAESRIDVLRPASTSFADGSAIVVSRPDNAGPGTLRDAIYRANRLDRRARIEFRVGSVRLETPLPPLANPLGISVDGNQGVSLSASEPFRRPLLHVAAPEISLSGLDLYPGGGPGIAVDAPNASLRSIRVEQAEVGVRAGPLASGLTVRESRFERNGIGLLIDATSPAVELSHSSFRGHARAAVWAVAPFDATGPEPGLLAVKENVFREDRIGVLALHVPLRLSGNEFVGAAESAIHIGGSGLQVEGNRVADGEALGLLADRLVDSRLAGNEIEGNESIGILIRSSENVQIDGNRLAANGYGIVDAFGADRRPNVIADNELWAHRHDAIWILAASPAVERNRVGAGRGAALRSLIWIDREGIRTAAEPVLSANDFHGNLIDEPVTGRLHEPEG